MNDNGYWQRLSARRASRRSVVAVGGAAGAAVLTAGILGCGDDDDGQPASPAGTQATEQPKRGGDLVFNFGSPGEAPHFDPHQNTVGVYFAWGPGIVHSRLLRKKVGPDIPASSLVPEGDLVQSWEQPDEQTYVMKLHPNVKWHNIPPVNGRQLTTQDVTYSMDRQRALSINAGRLPAAAVEATDPLTIRFKTPNPDADFLLAMTSPFNAVVAREAVEAKGDLKEGPAIGSNAWILREWQRNATVKFVRNPDYFRMAPDGKPFPYADTMEWLRITDRSTVLAAFRTGRLVQESGSKDEIDQLRRENPNIGIVKIQYSGPVSGRSLILNTQTPPFNDIRVRKAINLALDRKVANDLFANGEGSVNSTLLSTSSADQLLSNDEVLRLLPYDQARARQLLEQAGFRPATFKLGSAAGNPEYGEFVQRNLKAVGIETTIDSMDNIALGRFYTQHDRDLTLFLRSNVGDGPNADLRTGFKTSGSINVSNLSDPELDRLIDQQAVEVKDAQRRKTLLHDIQRKILDIASVTPYLGSPSYIMVRPDVRNVFRTAVGNFIDTSHYEAVWLDR